MSRNLTDKEKNQIKNLQVSNSIYKRDIKDLIMEIGSLQQQLEKKEAMEKTAVLDEQLMLSREIEQLKAEIGRRTGQIKHKEGRIAAKEAEIEEIQRASMLREDVVVESYNPNDPARLAAKAAAAPVPKDKKKSKKEKADDAVSAKVEE